MTVYDRPFQCLRRPSGARPPTVRERSTDHRPCVDRLSTMIDCPSTVADRPSTDRRPTLDRLPTIQSASRPSIVRASVVRRPSTARRPSSNRPSTVRRPTLDCTSTVLRSIVRRPSVDRRPTADHLRTVSYSVRRPSVDPVRRPPFDRDCGHGDRLDACSSRLLYLWRPPTLTS